MTVSLSATPFQEFNVASGAVYNADADGLVSVASADVEDVMAQGAILALRLVEPKITNTGPGYNFIQVNSPFSAWFNGTTIAAPSEGAYINGWNDFNLTTANLENVVGVGVAGLNVGGSTLTSLSAASLVICLGQIDMSNSSVLASVDFSALRVLGTAAVFPFNIGLSVRNTLLTSLSLPAIVYAQYLNGSSTPTLTSVFLGSTLKTLVQSVDFSGCGLDQASVDHILARLVALDGSNGTTIFNGDNGNFVDLSGGTNAAPSEQGASDATVLTDRGVTVTTN